MLNIPAILLLGGVAIGTIVLGGIAYYELKKAEARKRRFAIEAGAEREYSRWLATTERLGGIPSTEGVVNLPEGEECYFAARAKLKEPRSVTVSRQGGGSIYIAAGIRIYDGISVSEAHEEWRTVSTGVLYVTSKRIIFAGDTQTRTIDLRDVISISAGYRSISIGSTSHKKVMLFSGVNGQIARDTIIAMR